MATEAKFERVISPNEKGYLAIRSLSPPLVIQFVFAATVDSPAVDVQRLTEAVVSVGQVMPGTRLLAKGGMWMDSGIAPSVVLIDEKVEVDNVNAEWTKRPLHPRQGPTCEVLVLTASNSIVFRAFHGVTDGKGIELWARNVFRALRGETLVPCESRETDWELVQRIMPVATKVGSIKPQAADMARAHGKPLAKTGKKNEECGTVYVKRSITGMHPGLVAKIAAILAEDDVKGNTRYMIPVDMRRHDATLASSCTSNLSMPIFIQVSAGTPWQSVQSSLLTQLSQKAELKPSGMEPLAQNIPRRVFKHAVRLSEAMSRRTNKYLASGFLSHLGRMNVNDFSEGDEQERKGWKCASVWSLPTLAAMIPLALCMVEVAGGVQLVAAVQKDEAGKRAIWLESILEKVATALEHMKTPLRSKTPGSAHGSESEGSTLFEIETTQHVCPVIASPYPAPNVSEDATVISEIAKQCRAIIEDTPALVYRSSSVTANSEQKELSNQYDTLSYRDMMRRTRCFAHTLNGYLGQKAQRKAPIAILLPRTPTAIISILATWMAGSPFVPLDPEHPDDRLRLIIEDSGCVAVISNHIGKARLQNMGVQSVVVDAEEDMLAMANEDVDFAPAVSLTGEDVAYIIYTSGTTGKPKGVLCTHSNVLSYLLSVAPLYTKGAPKSCRYVLFTPLSFDLSITCLLLPLLTGGSIVLIEESGLPGARRALQDRPLHGGNIIKLTPTHLDLAFGLNIIENNVSWRLAVVGGEDLQMSTLHKARSVLGSEVVIVNEYGPTESTVGCVIKVVKPDDYPRTGATAHRSVPIGVPVGGSSVQLVEPKTLDLVRLGQQGEIVIFGPQVAKGYLGRTAEAFVEVDGQRGYRTGDLGSWVVADGTDGTAADCELVCHGRADGQVKISGFRVETGEITAVLQKWTVEDLNPEVAAAAPGTAVLAQCVVGSSKLDRNGASETVLVAYVVPSSTLSVSSPQVKSYLRRKLPKHMVPSVVMVMADIPVTLNGKLDVSAIPLTMDDGPADATTRDYASLTCIIRSIWSSVLCIPVTDDMLHTSDFHALGGDSLSLLRMLQMVEAKVTDTRGPFQKVFFELCVEHGVLEHPSVDRILKALEVCLGGVDLVIEK
ncbi:hypothetical protein DFJ77DRAFT_508106 [Powellomyces hirtus]|nr:hypothetical protein DFJ77DRAFT_508106 [Powellomyces hirtus]